MRIFGGFGGDHSHKDRNSVQPEELEQQLPEEQLPEEEPPAEETAPEPAAAEGGSPERTPEEKAEIDAMIAAYQKKKRRKRLIALGVAAALIIGGYIAYKSTVKPPKPVQPTPTAAPTVKPTTAPSEKPAQTPGQDAPAVTETPEPSAEPVRERLENVYTVLLLGREQSFGNTDTIMVARYDANNRELNILSIPRDTCANVESNTDQYHNETKKINSIFARAGVEGVKDAVSEIIGAPIDSYMMVGLSGLSSLVDTIGGVDFEVPYFMNYDDPTQDLHIHYNKGYQHITGYDAVRILRWRQNNDGTNYGDIARINTQQAFLTTVAKKCLTLSNIAKNLKDYVDILENNVKTDMANGNLLWFGKEFLQMSMDDIHFYTIPSNYNDNIRGFAYGTILVNEWLEMLNAHFNMYNLPLSAEDVNIIYRDENGKLCATSGEIRGGEDSFLEMSVYAQRLKAWQESQRSSGGETAGSSGQETPPSGGTGTGESGSGSGESASGETGSGESGSGESSSGENGSGEADSGEAGSGESGSGETGSGESGTGETGGEESGSGETGSGEGSASAAEGGTEGSQGGESGEDPGAPAEEPVTGGGDGATEEGTDTEA